MYFTHAKLLTDILVFLNSSPNRLPENWDTFSESDKENFFDELDLQDQINETELTWNNTDY